MNDIITIDTLASILAERTGLTADQARQYILIVQRSVTERLAEGMDTVEVPYLGAFKITDLPHGEIEFSPVQDIADAVNEPFSFFEAVEVFDNDAIENENENESGNETGATDLQTATEVTDTHEQPAEIATAEATYQDEIHEHPAEHEIPEPAMEPESIAHDTETAGIDEEVPHPEQCGPQDASDEIHLNNTPDETYEPETFDDNGSRAGMSPVITYILGILTGMILTCVAVYFLYPPLHTDDDDYDIEDTEIAIEQPATDITEPVTASETAENHEIEQDTAEQPSQVSVTPKTPENRQTVKGKAITDTVGPKYYLATMSRKYYGRMEFWIYIYKENESKLGNPDRIPVGTVVTIPPAEKYNIDPKSQESIDRARSEASALLEKYK